MWQTKYKENSTHEGFDPNFWWKKILSLKSVTDKRKRKFYSWEILSQLLTKEILNSEKVWQTKDKENSTYEGFDPNFQLKKILALKSVTDKKKRKFYLSGIWSKLLTEENPNSEKCDRQNTKKILLTFD